MSRFRDTRQTAEAPGDARLALWEYAELGAGALVLALLFRLFVFQSFTVAGPGMSETLLPGDRIFFNKLVYRFKSPAPGEVVVFRHPLRAGEFSVKRCVAGPGSTVRVEGKKMTVDGKAFQFPPTAHAEGQLTIDGRYSPRDNLAAFRLPDPEESVNLDSVSLFEFDFYLSLIRQENPGASLRTTADLLVDGMVNNDLKLENFKTGHRLPDGRIDFDALDWQGLNNVLNFLSARGDTSDYGFRRTLFMEGSRLKRYQVKGPCYFVAGDNWKESYDSRYFGFVSRKFIVARSAFVYWSNAGGGIRWKRIFRFVCAPHPTVPSPFPGRGGDIRTS